MPRIPSLGPGREFDLIRSFFPEGTSGSRRDVRVAGGDDCTVVAGDGIVLSVDMSVEGVHFRREWLEPREIGYRAAAAALSDLAAMAARPIGLLASVAVTEGDVEQIAGPVMAGVHEAVQRIDGELLGGDLTRSTGPLVLDIAVVGEAARPVLRSGAEVGDELWVTGELGAAALAVASLLRSDSPDPAARERYASPAPRTREARWLAERGIPQAMLDLSDGLGGDLGHLASASGVTCVIEADRVPIHPVVMGSTPGRADALDLALTGGEDYEICLAARAGAVEPCLTEFQATFGIRLSRVGWVESGEGVFLENAAGKRSQLVAAGFQHFGGDG